MDAVLSPSAAAALPQPNRIDAADAAADTETTANLAANRAWEIDRALMLERSERRAWTVAAGGMLLGLIGIAAVFVQGPLRRVVEVPIVVDRITGEATVQQRLSVESIPPIEALDKHNLATFVRAREGYSWMFLQRDYDQVARMAVPAVFADYNRLFEGDAALQKKLAAAEDWRIAIVGVRLSAMARAGNSGQATVTYDKVVHLVDRNLPDTTTRHVASIVYQYQPSVLAKERDRLENPFGFVVTAYRSDPEINTPRRRRASHETRLCLAPAGLCGIRRIGCTAAARGRSARSAPARGGLRPACRRHRASKTRRRHAGRARRRRGDRRGRRRAGWRLRQARGGLVHRRAGRRPAHLRQAEVGRIGA